MRRKNLLKELGIQKQADASRNALDILSLIHISEPTRQ